MSACLDYGVLAPAVEVTASSDACLFCLKVNIPKIQFSSLCLGLIFCFVVIAVCYLYFSTLLNVLKVFELFSG